MENGIRFGRPVVLADRLYFGVGESLWSSDGTAAGTKEFMPGRVDLRTRELGPAMAQIGARVMLVQDGVYKLKDTLSGAVLNTGILYSNHPFYTSIVVVDDHFVFVGRENVSDLKLYKLAADSDQPELIRNINNAFSLSNLPESDYAYPIVAKGRVYYPDQLTPDPRDGSRYNATNVLMETDIQTGQTTAINPQVGTYGTDATVVAQSDQWTWFTTESINTPIKIWQSDGTPAGTFQLLLPDEFAGATEIRFAQWIGERLVFDLTTSFPFDTQRLSWDPLTETWETLSPSTSGPLSKIFEINGEQFQVRVIGTGDPTVYRVNSDMSVGDPVAVLPNDDNRTLLGEFEITQAAGFTLLGNNGTYWLTTGSAPGTRRLNADNANGFVDVFEDMIVDGQDIWFINTSWQFYRLSAGESTLHLVGNLPAGVFPLGPHSTGLTLSAWVMASSLQPLTTREFPVCM